MPMFDPSKKLGLVGFNGGGNGRVLDLATAIKDGVLGGDLNVGYVGEVENKLDLKEMIEELNLAEIPSLFICPISLEPMQDPVSLCTGQTYEKSNILKWFGLGHYTCPTTMQELWDDAITPNKTLYDLIYTWFSQKYVQMKKRSDDAQGRVSELLTDLKNVKGRLRIQTLKELKQLVANHLTARNKVVSVGGISLLSSLLGPFTSYSVGCEVVAILVNLSLNPESKTYLMPPAKVSSVVDILNEGTLDTKMNCVRLIEMLLEDRDFTVSSHSLLVALVRLVRDKRHPNGHLPALGLLKSICAREHVRSLVVSIGAVPQLVESIPVLNHDCIELALSVLEVLSSVHEGRQALKDCLHTIPNMVKLIMRVSERCTEYALSILCSVWELSPVECSLASVEAGLAAKLLLVIQSGCNSVLKQQASELLKLCSLNCTNTIFISKCKLTRTIQ